MGIKTKPPQTQIVVNWHYSVNCDGTGLCSARNNQCVELIIMCLLVERSIESASNRYNNLVNIVMLEICRPFCLL